MRGNSLFSIEWLSIAIALGIGIQIVGWIAGIGLLTGLPAYFLVGVLTGWGSPGKTLVEPGVAAFLIATTGFVLNHIWLSLFGVGLMGAILYGMVGLTLALLGAWIAETYLDS